MGAGGHGHGHGPPYSIPDYRIYKVEDCPKLVEVQEALAAQGLKDPWLRNEVWRFRTDQNWGTPASRLKTLFFRGFKFGFALFVVTVAGTEVYDRMYPSEHGHGHGGGHH